MARGDWGGRYLFSSEETALGSRMQSAAQIRGVLEGSWGRRKSSRFIMGIVGVSLWVIGVMNLLTKSP